MTPNPNQPPDPRRRFTPFIAGVIGLFVVVAIVGFFLNGSPERHETDGIAQDPNISSINLDAGVQRPTFDVGAVMIVDSGVPDPEAIAEAMKQVGAVDGGAADAG